MMFKECKSSLFLSMLTVSRDIFKAFDTAE